MSCWDNIDAVYYINLNHRTDRLVQISAEMDKVYIPFSKRIRIEAEYTPECGALGCCLSHIKALQHFLESDGNICIIFEDDFQFTVPPEQVHSMMINIQRFNGYYDLIMLAGNVIRYQQTNVDTLYKVIEAQTTSGYMITRNFAVKLLSLWKKTAMLIKQHVHGTGIHNIFLACDRTWKQLQPEANWFVCNPCLGIQRESYSDIEKEVMNYGC